MKSALLKDSMKEIKNTLKRFISILLIVLLGVGFFCGIKATSPDMKKTIDEYFDNQNVMDIQVLSTLGLTESDLKELEKVKGVESIEGAYLQDVIVNLGEEEIVVKLESLPANINMIETIEGRLPENEKECVVEKSFLQGTNHQIGDTIEIKAEKIKDEDGNEKELLKENQVIIVGTVESPLYISRERGSTKLGSGKIRYYMFTPLSNFQADYYTNAYLTAEGAKKQKSYSDEYEDTIDEVKNRIEEIAEERKQARYDEIYHAAEEKIKEGEEKLNSEKQKAEKELNDARKKLEDAKQNIETAKKELASNKNKANAQFQEAEAKLKTAEATLKEKQEQFALAKKEANEKIEEANQNVTNLKNTQEKYQSAKENLATQEKNLQQLQNQLSMLDPIQNQEEIAQIQAQMDSLQIVISSLKKGIQTIETTLQSQGIQTEQLAVTIANIQNEIKNAQAELKKNENLLKTAQKELETQKQTYQTTKKQTNAKLTNAQSQIETAQKEIKSNEKKLEESQKEFDEKIEEAQEEIEKAKLGLAEIKKSEWYILDRNQNVGYVSYMQDTDRIGNIAKVFPLVFFVVAALISLTSMTRMVEEQRVQIGTLKALGYKKMQIASKYILYSALATIIGGTIGMIIGFQILPKVIINMYQMMYSLPEAIIEFNIEYAIIGMSFAILCTVGATIYSCSRALASTPAKLMRPKAPKPGKRVWLEKIPFIWKRLNFTKKVTVRNLFRYKKRFLMTIIGVAGCTALIIAGFALRDSVSGMIPSQYGEIFKYNLQISLKDNLTKKEIKEEYQKIENMECVQDLGLVNMQSIEIEKENNNQSIQLVVPEKAEELSTFIVLQSRTKKQAYTLDNEGIIITEKLAKLLDIQVGDGIVLKNTDNIKVTVKVKQITENYLQHYIYMSPSLYETLYHEEMKPNVILVITDELSEEQENALGKTILENKEVISAVSFTSAATDIFATVMDNMNFVVWILIIAAGLLALVVLYNLSNTNISERIRELATIKVLGFYDKEVYNYVNKETTILTAIGILFGLVGGYFLTAFIIKTCELDMLMFNPKVAPMSYVYGILITTIFAVIVSIGTYFALKKIDMIESLKSVE